MNPLVHFSWYRQMRGGVWGHHSALFHPWKTWTRLNYMPPDFSVMLGDEDWRDILAHDSEDTDFMGLDEAKERQEAAKLWGWVWVAMAGLCVFSALIYELTWGVQ